MILAEIVGEISGPGILMQMSVLVSFKSVTTFGGWRETSTKTTLFYVL